jgi:UDP-N-acetylmuramate dehydrogenase
MIKKFIENNNLGTIYENKRFKDLTTLKIGGNIKFYYLPNSMDSFSKFYSYASSKLPIFIIGSGSNVLASDEDYSGVVVSFKNIPIKFARVGDVATIYAGCKLTEFIYRIAEVGLGGLEDLCGIPGTIGGMVAMNAGSFGTTISDVLISAECLDHDGKLATYSNKELLFGYRSSLIRMKDLIVISAKIKLIPKEQQEILEIIETNLEKRRKNQPLNTMNAGCAFKNNISHSAWSLIDGVNLRGYAIGDAQVSEKHCNFLINKSNAKAEDMFSLIKKIKKEVKDKYDIDLIYEWVLINFCE